MHDTISFLRLRSLSSLLTLQPPSSPPPPPPPSVPSSLSPPLSQRSSPLSSPSSNLLPFESVSLTTSPEQLPGLITWSSSSLLKSERLPQSETSSSLSVLLPLTINLKKNTINSWSRSEAHRGQLWKFEDNNHIQKHSNHHLPEFCKFWQLSVTQTCFEHFIMTSS